MKRNPLTLNRNNNPFQKPINPPENTLNSILTHQINTNNGPQTEESNLYINENHIPPSEQECKDFKRSSSVGYVTSYHKKCKSNLMFVNNEQFSLCDPIDKFSEMGLGYSLYFKFLKFLIFVCVFPFFLLSIWNMKRNIEGHDCVKFDDVKQFEYEVDNTDI